jgi:hypothetical protein
MDEEKIKKRPENRSRLAIVLLEDINLFACFLGC